MSKQSDLINLTDAITVDGTNVHIADNTNGPDAALHIEKTTPQIRLQINGNSGYNTIESGGVNELIFGRSGSEQGRFDSSGNLLVGMTSASTNNDGAGIRADGLIHAKRADVVATFNRKTSSGTIVEFAKDNTVVGSISTQASNNQFQFNAVGVNAYVGITWKNEAEAIYFLDTHIRPGTNKDNVYDIGRSDARFDDIYATNGTIQTSDRNEKQDIEALSDAEQRVAVATKGLLRKYRWKDAVAEKGDAARIHFGIIAQDLQAAFEAEGLDAARYGMFISSTWWEAERVIPAVEAKEAVLDSEGNVLEEAVEAQPERTVVDTYETQDEAPEGATERTRLGVRYPELLAFIIAAL